MDKTIKIAIYTGIVPSTTFIERLIQGLTNKGVNIYLFGFQSKKITPIKNTFYVTYSNKFSKLFLLIKYSLLLTLFKIKDKKKLDKIILNQAKNTRQLKVKYYPVLYHRPDIFHLQWAKSIIDWAWVKEFDIKLIVSLRGAHINYSPIADKELANYYKELFPKVDGFHAVSKAIAKESLKYNALEKRIKVIYSGLDLNQIKYQVKPYDSNSPLKIISVGRAHWKKGYSYALNSIGELKKMGVKIDYTIVGISDNEELLYQRRQLGLEKEVDFIGSLPFKEVLKSIKNADVFLLPSIEEGIANVVLESMAIGTLVVSTDCGGMTEVLNNDENGFIVPIRDSNKMASALYKVSGLTSESYHKMTLEARNTIEKQHHHELMINNMQNLYDSVLNDNL